MTASSPVDSAPASRLSAEARVLLFSTGLALTAAAFVGLFLRDLGRISGTTIEISPLALIGLFAASEILSVHLETRGEAHSVTFSEIPMVMALALASPASLVLGRLVGAFVVLGLLRRQSVRKVYFNLALFALESCLAVFIYRAVLGDGDPIKPIGWAAALVALMLVYAFSAAAVTAVITLHSGWPGRTSVFRVVTLGAFVGLANICVGLGATGALYQNAWLAGLVGVVAIILYLVSRSHMALAQRYESLETLHTFTRTVGRSLELPAITADILRSARELLRAEHAALLMFDPDSAEATLIIDSDGEVASRRLAVATATAGLEEVLPDRKPRVLSVEHGTLAWLDGIRVKDAAAVPLLGDSGTVGVLLVANRLASISTFEPADMTLFETLANHASVALDNGRLFTRLGEEVAERTHQAWHDSLTGLPNRELLDMRLTEAIATASRVGQRVAVLLLDLEGFKEVNDTLGHHTGDLLLQQVANRLGETVPRSATLARFGGDEFVTVAEVEGRTDAARLADDLLESMSAPFLQGELSLALGASIGVALFPDHGTESATLLQRADVAMYGAKAAHVGYDIYAIDRDPFTSRRLALVGSLREAIGRQEIEVHYQPQVDLLTNMTVGAEGLVRWRHPQLGLLPPSEFVAAVEQTSIIQPLTNQVLRSALRAARGWRDDGYDIGVAVNLSVRSLLDPGLPGEVLDALVEAQLPADLLTLEITENSVMTDSRRVLGVLSQLREMGVRLSIDDFGTGYSSLAQLRRIPVSEIKIDRSFVMGLTLDEQDAAIVRSTIELGHQLGLRVVAEGVESQDALDRLTMYGCDAVQGFAISRARPADSFDTWLVEHGAARLPQG